MKKATGFVLTFLIITSAFSQNTQQYSVDIPNPKLFAVQQHQTNWCWAACNQMLLNAISINETQENQVLKLFGQVINEGAGQNYEKAKLALAGTYLTNHQAQDSVLLPLVTTA